MPNKNMIDTVTLDLSHIYFLQSCSDIKAEKVQDFFFAYVPAHVPYEQNKH